MLYEFTNKE
jgi:hypothetical protein